MVASLSSIDDLASLALCVFSVHFLFLFRSFSCVVLGGFRQRRRGPALARAKHAAATSGGRRSDSWPQSPCNRHSSKRVRILSWVEFVTKQLVMMSESRFFFLFLLPSSIFSSLSMYLLLFTYLSEIFTAAGGRGGGKTYRLTKEGHTFLGNRDATLPPQRLSRELLMEDLKTRKSTSSSSSSSSSSSASYLRSSSSSSAAAAAGGGGGDGGVNEDGLTSEEQQLYIKIMALRQNLAKETTRKRRITCAPWMIMSKSRVSLKINEVSRNDLERSRNSIFRATHPQNEILTLSLSLSLSLSPFQ
jgi:hypothetical protein